MKWYNNLKNNPVIGFYIYFGSAVLGLVIIGAVNFFQSIRPTVAEDIIIFLLTTIAGYQVQRIFTHAIVSTKAEESHNVLDRKISEAVQLSNFHRKIKEIGYPHYVQLAELCYNECTSKCKELSEGKYHVKFFDPGAFMPNDWHKIDKIKDLKILSLVRKYTDDICQPNSPAYIKAQENIIKNGGKVTRILLFSNQKDHDTYKDEMDNLCNIGVCIYYIRTDTVTVNLNTIPINWLNEDYVIINDELLIKQIIYSSTGKFTGTGRNTDDDQLVTIEKTQLNEKIDRFYKLMQEATLYRCEKAKIKLEL